MAAIAELPFYVYRGRNIKLQLLSIFWERNRKLCTTLASCGEETENHVPFDHIAGKKQKTVYLLIAFWEQNTLYLLSVLPGNSRKTCTYPLIVLRGRNRKPCTS